MVVSFFIPFAFACHAFAVTTLPRPHSLTAGANFGTSAAADSTYIAVGAHLDNNETGAVVLYNDSLDVVYTLHPTSASVGAQFGCAVSISSGMLAVGAQNDGGHKSQHGSVFLFVLGNATIAGKLSPPTRRDGQSFGGSVSLNADATLLVTGATNEAGVGAAHVFIRGRDWEDVSGMKSIQITAPPELHPGANFGQSITVHTTSLNSHIVLVGANHAYNSSGAVFLYTMNYLGHVLSNFVLTAIETSPGSFFGSSLAVAQTQQGCIVAAVGAPWAGRGDVYLFSTKSNFSDKSSWVQTKIAAPAAASQSANFGISLAMSPRPNSQVLELAIGAWNDGTTGAAYLYDVACSAGGSLLVVMIEQLKPPIKDPAFFGSSVALHDSMLVVGADGESHSDGAAYSFGRGSSNAIVV